MLEKTQEDEPRAPKPYLDADFGKELSYQLWVTKGARFHANRRLDLKQRWSTYTITALALYAITANLITAYGITEQLNVSTELAFASSVMSVFILILSLLEGARQYNLRASHHHDCAREISKLYRRLRQLRTGPGDPLTPAILRELAEQYEAILDRFENHEDIDYYLLQAKKSEWFNHGLVVRVWFRLRWYLQTLFLYHVAILAPPIFFLGWWHGSGASA